MSITLPRGMLTRDARVAGETEQRLYAIGAWSETPFYTERERAALARTEALTLRPVGHGPDEVYISLIRPSTAVTRWSIWDGQRLGAGGRPMIRVVDTSVHV